ncbi:hypothetical protein AVEN_41545-1, partial [Araneus ventricosus]
SYSSAKRRFLKICRPYDESVKPTGYRCMAVDE